MILQLLPRAGVAYAIVCREQLTELQAQRTSLSLQHPYVQQSPPLRSSSLSSSSSSSPTPSLSRSPSTTSTQPSPPPAPLSSPLQARSVSPVPSIPLSRRTVNASVLSDAHAGRMLVHDDLFEYRIDYIIEQSSLQRPTLLVLEALPWNVLRSPSMKRLYALHRDRGIMIVHLLSQPTKLDVISRMQLDVVAVFDSQGQPDDYYDCYFSWRAWEQPQTEYTEMHRKMSRDGQGFIAVRHADEVSFYRYGYPITHIVKARPKQRVCCFGART